MSDKDLDKLFKNKLEEFGKAPSRDLWANIDKQLPENKKKGGYWLMSIAASIVILMAIGLGFYLNDDIEIENDTIAKNEKPTEIDSVEPKNEEDNLIQEQPVENEAEVSNSKSVDKEESKQSKPVVKPSIQKTIHSTIQQEEFVAEKAEDKTEDITLKEQVESIEIDQSQNIATNEKVDATTEKQNASSNKHTGNTLTFDINDLGKKEVLASNDTEEEIKKKSKLKQLFNIAKDIKEGESGLSDLREAKNELFAMNFRKNENGK